MQEFKLYETVDEVWKFISFCDSFIEKEKPWQIKNKKKLREVLSDLLFCIFEISGLIAPFLPETSEKIKKQIKSNKPEILFKRIDVN